MFLSSGSLYNLGGLTCILEGSNHLFHILTLVFDYSDPSPLTRPRLLYINFSQQNTSIIFLFLPSVSLVILTTTASAASVLLNTASVMIINSQSLIVISVVKWERMLYFILLPMLVIYGWLLIMFLFVRRGQFRVFLLHLYCKKFSLELFAVIIVVGGWA